MARSRRRSLPVTIQQPLRITKPHPIAMRPIVVGVRPTAFHEKKKFLGSYRRRDWLGTNTPRRTATRARTSFLGKRTIKDYYAYRLGNPILEPVWVRPRKVRVVAKAGKVVALLGTKHRRLCKCRHDRSPAQQRVARSFFSRYGGRGGGRDRRPQDHACTC